VTAMRISATERPSRSMAHVHRLRHKSMLCIHVRDSSTLQLLFDRPEREPNRHCQWWKSRTLFATYSSPGLDRGRYNNCISRVAWPKVCNCVVFSCWSKLIVKPVGHFVNRICVLDPADGLIAFRLPIGTWIAHEQVVRQPFCFLFDCAHEKLRSVTVLGFRYGVHRYHEVYSSRVCESTTRGCIYNTSTQALFIQDAERGTVHC
jgi:hypothetical protein